MSPSIDSPTALAALREVLTGFPIVLTGLLRL